jgi:two-component system response regulator AtoC
MRAALSIRNPSNPETMLTHLLPQYGGKAISEDHLDASIMRSPKSDSPAAQEIDLLRSLPTAVEALERRMIEQALRESGGKKQKAAQALGLSRQGLIKKLKRLAIG